METEKKRLSEYVLQKGDELFGKDFVVETIDNPTGATSFYKMHISQVLYKSEPFADIDMYIMQNVGAKEVFVCNNGYIRDVALKKLVSEKNCKIEIRNNRIGYCGNYETKKGIWKRINYFSSQSENAIDIFLNELNELRISSKEELRYPDAPIIEFEACIWKMIQDIFNPKVKNDLKVEYYPMRDSKEEYNCATFIVWLNKEDKPPFFIKINRFPNYQEFVCYNPGRYWRTENRNDMSPRMRRSYDEEMEDFEEKLIKALHRTERKSILLMGPDEEVPYVHIAEVRTSNLKVVEILLDKLKGNKIDYALQSAIRADRDYQYKKDIHYNFY